MTLTVDNTNRSLLDRYNALGSVLDVHAFAIRQYEETDHEISLQAVMMAMRMIVKENDGSPWRISADANSGPYKIYEDIIPEGKIISIADFLGPGYNLTTGEVQLFGYFDKVWASSIRDGLAYAMLNPPHGLLQGDDNTGSVEFGQKKQRMMTELFNGFLKDVLLIQDIH